jgi:hypothetical protein
VKALRLSAALAALVVTASTACAAVIDFSNVLGPSGGYTSRAYYQTMLGDQPMTAAQQAYADQEDELRQMGFRLELVGDIALGQMFYHIAYGMIPPPSAADSVSGGSGLDPFSSGPNNGGAGFSGASGAGSSGASDPGFGSMGDTAGSVLTLALPPLDPGVGWVIAVPEASTWAMMLLGFGSLYAGWHGSRRPILHSA